MAPATGRETEGPELDQHDPPAGVHRRDRWGCATGRERYRADERGTERYGDPEQGQEPPAGSDVETHLLLAEEILFPNARPWNHCPMWCLLVGCYLGIFFPAASVGASRPLYRAHVPAIQCPLHAKDNGQLRKKTQIQKQFLPNEHHRGYTQSLLPSPYWY